MGTEAREADNPFPVTTPQVRNVLMVGSHISVLLCSVAGDKAAGVGKNLAAYFVHSFLLDRDRTKGADLCNVHLDGQSVVLK